MSKSELNKLELPGMASPLVETFRHGASRRRVMRCLIGSGLRAATAGKVATLAEAAHAQTPRGEGKIEVASHTNSNAETLDRRGRQLPRTSCPSRCSSMG